MISYQCSRYRIGVSASSWSPALPCKQLKSWMRNQPLKWQQRLPLHSLLSRYRFSKLALTIQTPSFLARDVYTSLSFLRQRRKILISQRYSSFKQFSHLFITCNLLIPTNCSLIITHYSLLSLFITCNLSLHTNCSLLIAHYSLLLCSITIS
jgi:hypothetical protein